MAEPRIVVAVKQVRIASEDLEVFGSAVPEDLLDRALNEWDSHAVEEAIRLREEAGGGEVIAMSVGDAATDEVLRRCVAMGVDRAVRIDANAGDPISVARFLAPEVAAQSPDLVLCGVQSSDSVQGATGGALAELLGFPVVVVVKQIDWSGSGTAIVHRELEGGLIDLIEVETPAVLTIQTGINQPRYVTLRALKQADQQEIPVITPAPVTAPAYSIRSMYVPRRTARAEILNGDGKAIAARILELLRESTV